LAPTGILSLVDQVGIPCFNSTLCEADHRGNQTSHFEHHYASQVALRRLCSNLHQNISDSSQFLKHLAQATICLTDKPLATSNSDTASSSGTDYGGPTASFLKQLALQLSQWRGMLPQDLQWAEDDPTSYPSPQLEISNFEHQQLDPNLSQLPKTSKKLFTTDLDSEPMQYPYAYDIQVALLRTRYYYARYIIYRPFVYKALHYPEQMTQEDAEGVADCLRVSLTANQRGFC
jgi:hypothetical protein